MNRPEVISQLEELRSSHLDHICADLKSRHPDFIIRLGSGTVGDNTEFQGYHIFIDCDRRGSEDPEPNCVTLEICAKYLDTTPLLCSLDVCWGGDGTPLSDPPDYLPTTVPWDEDSISLIHETLPKLKSDLDECLVLWEDTYLEKSQA